MATGHLNASIHPMKGKATLGWGTAMYLCNEQRKSARDIWPQARVNPLLFPP